MGKTKIKTIEEVEEKKKTKTAKFEHNKVVGAVEPEVKLETMEDSIAKQAHSERTGDASGTLVSNEQAIKPAKKSKKPGKQKKMRSKKYQEVLEKVDRAQKYSLIEAIKLAQSTSYSKFPGTLEAHFNTNVKNIRGLVTLPHFAGKKLVILAFGKDADKSGADLIGTEEAIVDIEKGPSTSLRVNTENKVTLLDIDIIVTSPEWMPKLARVAKILGPRGLMPNPKNGTITENLTKTITELQAGKIEYKTESNGEVIHLPVGKVSQDPEEIAANIRALYQVIGKSKVSKITLASTMGIGVKVNLTSI